MSCVKSIDVIDKLCRCCNSKIFPVHAIDFLERIHVKTSIALLISFF